MKRARQIYRLLTVILLSIGFKPSQAQNLVPNPGFEVVDTCPVNFSKVEWAPPWYNPNNCTPDLFDSCTSFPSIFGTPYNNWSYQRAHTGIAYAGVYVYGSTNNLREYVQVPLSESLVQGHTYCAGFYVNPAFDNSYHMAITEIGMLFSTAPVTANNMNYFNDVPQVVSPAGVFISDTANWTLVTGSFTALGGEQYITIGNFKSYLNTDTLELGTIGGAKQSYYFIDDVSVVDCTTGISETSAAAAATVYPNPFTTNATIRFDNPGHETCVLTLYDACGREVQTITDCRTDNVVLEKTNMEAGLYYFVVRSPCGVKATGKLVVD